MANDKLFPLIIEPKTPYCNFIIILGHVKTIVMYCKVHYDRGCLIDNMMVLYDKVIYSATTQHKGHVNLSLGLIFFNTWFTDFFSKY